MKSGSRARTRRFRRARRCAGALLALILLVSVPVSADETVMKKRERGAAAAAQGREDAATRRLWRAAAAGRVGSVRMALDAGARIDENRTVVTGQAGAQTPLVAAALRGHERVVRLLLELGADPTIPEQDGFTVWHAAAFQGRKRVLEVLDELEVPGYGLSPADGYAPLHRAAWGPTLRHVDAVRYLIGPGGRACDVRAADGKTPLDLAKHAETKALLAACVANAHPVADSAGEQAPRARDSAAGRAGPP